MNNLVDFFSKVSTRKQIEISARFELIIESQMRLLLQRGVPAEKLIAVINKLSAETKTNTKAS